MNRSIQIFISFLFLFLSLGLSIQGHAQQTLFEHFTQKEGLLTNKIFDSEQGAGGNLWFASSKGMCRFDGLGFKCFDKRKGLEGEILGIYRSESGGIWCYSSGGNVYRFDNECFTEIQIDAKSKEMLSNRIINSMFVDNNGDVWLSTVISGGLFKVAEEKTARIEIGNEYSFYIREIDENGFICGSNSTATENNKLRVLTKNKPFTITLSQKGSYSKSSFIQLQNGTFLFAKDYELVHFNSAAVIKRAFVEKSVESLLEDSEGKIWVALYTGGALCYPDGNISSGSPVSYLGNKTISSITEDNSGNIWFTTTEDGIFSLPARPNINYTAPEVYSKTNSNEVEEMHEPIISQRELEVSNGTDFMVLTTDTSGYDTVPPTVFVSGLKIMDKDTTLLTHYDLAYDENFIKVYYVGFAYHNPEILQYRYKMEGIDRDWVYTNSTFAPYTTLPPGKYKFIVSAMNKHGFWSKSPASITFVIHPPFWITWWFITLLVVFALGIIGWVFYTRLRQIRKKEHNKAAINKKIANVELQALRSQMNPHFIFNTMSSIQHYITNNDTEAALKYLSKFAKLMRSIMENSRRPVILVRDELAALELYLELETLRFKDKFDHAIEVDASIDVHNDEIPAMLIQPYVENAILHGIMHKETKGNLKITLKKQLDIITCVIEDDGIGRKKSIEINSADNQARKSLGMSITKERLEIINSLSNSKLGVNIIDLEDDEGAATGTKVEIFIPVDKND